MMISRTNIVLATLLVFVMLLTATTRVDYSRPNIEILPDMKYTPAWTTYAANPNFVNGRTLQAPVVGTIARGESPLHYAATPEDALRAGEELLNPYDVAIANAAEQNTADDATPGGQVSTDDDSGEQIDDRAQQIAAAQDNLRESVQRGGDIYGVFCISCHGPSGAGDGPVTKRGFPPPPSFLTGKSPQMKDGQLFHILTYGQGSMALMAGQLSPASRWDVINYIRNMQQSAPANAVTDSTDGSATDVGATATASEPGETNHAQ